MGCPQNIGIPTLIPPLVFLMFFFFDNSTSEMDFGGQEISVDLLLVAEGVKKKVTLGKWVLIVEILLPNESDEQRPCHASNK